MSYGRGVFENSPVEERGLERQGQRMAHLAVRLVLIGLVIALPGIVLIVIDAGTLGIGVGVVLLASIPVAFGVALLCSSAVARWAARHKLFA
jgi:uncharacterized membrane protein